MLDNHQFHIPRINKIYLLRFNSLLRSNKYTEKTFRSLKFNPYQRRYVTEYLVLYYKLHNENSLTILIKLFMLGSSVEESKFKSEFGTEMLDFLVRINVLEIINPGYIRSLIMIIPYNKFYFVSDFLFRYDCLKQTFTSNNFYNVVYPVSLDSLMLWHAIIKNKISSALDLCTGCGVHAILLSPYVRRIIGVDLNQRAINFSKFNAIFNSISNVEFVTGDLYQPLDRIKFDLIVSNPPDQISFGDKRMLSDGGRYGDDLYKKIVKGLPYHLNRYGMCQVITTFFEVGSKKEQRKKLLEEWLLKKSFEVFFLIADKMDQHQYASFTSSYSSLKLSGFQKRFTGLIQTMETNNIQSATFGILTIKRSNYFKYQEKDYIDFIILPVTYSDIIRKYFNTDTQK